MEFIETVQNLVAQHMIELRNRMDFLENLLDDTHRVNYEDDTIKAYEEEYERAEKEMQKCSDLSVYLDHIK